MNAKQTIHNILAGLVQDMGLTWPQKTTIEPPREKGHGDMASNMAMVLAGQAKKKPRDLAEELCQAILKGDHPIKGIEVAGPGFLNFTFEPAFWQQVLPQVLQAGEDFGRGDMGKGRKVQVEFVSANPTGPLHIGHGRGAAVGDSLARVLRFTGHEVGTEYYVNDAGRQMRLLGLSVYTRAQQSKGQDVELPDDCYKGDYIKDIAAEVLGLHPDLLDKPEDEGLSICQKYAADSILNGIKKDLQEFGVEHQVWFSEKSLVDSGAVDRAFTMLTDMGHAFEQDGAFWFKATNFGDDKDRVLRKSDGSLTYFASDIAYHADKFARGFDLLVDVWGADHHGYIPRMNAAVEALGKERDQFQVILVQLVNLLQGGEQVAMSTRAGKFETLADVCAEVGSDAARFIFLSRKSDSHLDFDLELAKQKSMDNPVYYVQYAHARVCSLMRKAAEKGITRENLGEPTPEILARLDTDADLDLLKLLARFPDTTEAAAAHLSTHLVSYYLMDLAAALHRYYTLNPVLAAPEPEIVKARIFLLLAVARTVKNGLALLGVSAPESM